MWSLDVLSARTFRILCPLEPSQTLKKRFCMRASHFDLERVELGQHLE